MIGFGISEEGDEILSLTVGEDFDGRCIKEFLAKAMRLSSTLIKKVKYGGVRVCGDAVTMRMTVRTGDEVTVVLPHEESENILPVDIHLAVAYEDEHILVANKPTNMPTHPSRGNSLPTLAEAVRAHVGRELVFRAVNRLDRDTSGLVVIAKNQYAAGILSAEIKAGGFEKYYTALLSRAPLPPSGIIDAPIERECEGSMRRVVRDGGKRAVTEYSVTELLPDGRALCEIRLHTGRTHQIRVHLAHIGAPLYADFLYGERIEGESYYLRAHRIAFTHPITGKRLVIKAV